jgi:hypothetical protein
MLILHAKKSLSRGFVGFISISRESPLMHCHLSRSALCLMWEDVKWIKWGDANGGMPDFRGPVITESTISEDAVDFGLTWRF